MKFKFVEIVVVRVRNKQSLLPDHYQYRAYTKSFDILLTLYLSIDACPNNNKYSSLEPRSYNNVWLVITPLFWPQNSSFLDHHFHATDK